MLLNYPSVATWLLMVRGNHAAERFSAKNFSYSLKGGALRVHASNSMCAFSCFNKIIGGEKFTSHLVGWTLTLVIDYDSFSISNFSSGEQHIYSLNTESGY